MVTEYSDTRVFLRCVDPARVRDSLAALFAREGMRPVAVPGERPLYRDPIGSPNWRVALLIGIGEWSCLQYDPWTLLTKSAPGAEGSRFEELCLLLGCPGLLIDINNGGIHASLLIECDGRGSSRCSAISRQNWRSSSMGECRCQSMTWISRDLNSSVNCNRFATTG